MKIDDLHIKSKSKHDYNATGTYEDGHFTLKKGSKINNTVAKSKTYSLSSKLIEMREDTSLITKEYIIKKDIFFKSSSLAAQFVCGYSINGLTRWKNSEGKCIKDIIGGK